VFPPDRAGTDCRVRIFMRNNQAPFPGYPTIGTAFALAHAGTIKPDTTRSVFDLGVGPTPIDLEWAGPRLRLAWMTQLKPTFGKIVTDSASLATALGPRAVRHRQSAGARARGRLRIDAPHRADRDPRGPPALDELLEARPRRVADRVSGHYDFPSLAPSALNGIGLFVGRRSYDGTVRALRRCRHYRPRSLVLTSLVESGHNWNPR
jgi:hypothetical protein